MKTFTFLVALLVAPAAFADDTKTPADKPAAEAPAKPAKPAKLTQAELQVLAHYHTVNLMEVDLGKAAKLKAAGQGVKDYGAMMIKDHGDSDKKLIAFAKKTGQKIPALKPATQVEKQELAEAKVNAAKLKKLEGADFDKEYLRMMVADHEKELAKIDAKIAEVQNTELADMLKAKKPVLQHHADHARELQKTEVQASR